MKCKKEEKECFTLTKNYEVIKKYIWTFTFST